jgi:hypothetical protein
MSNVRKPTGAKVSRLKPGGKRKMAEKEGAQRVLENVGRLFSIESAKKFAAWYIDTSEKVANQAIDFQESATKWAKETPLAPVFEAQIEYGKKFVERSAGAARSLWRIE